MCVKKSARLGQLRAQSTQNSDLTPTYLGAAIVVKVFAARWLPPRSSNVHARAVAAPGSQLSAWVGRPHDEDGTLTKFTFLASVTRSPGKFVREIILTGFTTRDNLACLVAPEGAREIFRMA